MTVRTDTTVLPVLPVRDNKTNWFGGLILLLQCKGAAIPSVAPNDAAPDAPTMDAGAPLTRAEACAATPIARGSLKPGATPFVRAGGECHDVPPSECDWNDTAPDAADTCFVATDNITRAEKEALSSSAPNHVPAVYLDKVDAHLHFTDSERKLLDQNHFVVLDRVEYGSYAVAYHDIFQQQLPVFVSIDSILQSIFIAQGAILENAEKSRLGPSLARLLSGMIEVLPSSGYPKDTARDLDVYLSVAKNLLHSHAPTAIYPEDLPIVTKLLANIAQSGAAESVPLFGRERTIDFNRFTPRGRYTADIYGGGSPMVLGHHKDHGYDFPEVASLAAYFQAMVWLSHTEFNVVSRDSQSSTLECEPSETPREARDAMAVADLAKRAGVLDVINDFERVYSVFAGRREDVSVTEMLTLLNRAHTSPSDTGSPDKLRAVIGAQFKRTTNTHPMSDCAHDLPVIATLFGERVVPDIAPLTHLVHPHVSGRNELGAGDVGYALGQDRAKHFLGADLKAYTQLATQLDVARGEMVAGAKGKTDLYSSWLRAVLALAEAPTEHMPPFMKTTAYADMRLNSALVGYGQIRHNFVLLAAEGYDQYGCEIPDGWVEPAVATYTSLLDYVRAAKALDSHDAKYFARVETILSMLRRISLAELRGTPMSEPDRRWLAMIAEHIPLGGYGDSSVSAKYTGWYFDLFPDREIGAEKTPEFVADFLTLTNAGKVAYLGATSARLGVFLVDTGSGEHAMVGPVAKGFEVKTPLTEPRLTDETVVKNGNRSATWMASYLAPKLPDPPISVSEYSCDDGTERFVLRGPESNASLTLLDHHGDPASDAIKFRLHQGQAVVAFPVRAPREATDGGADPAYPPVVREAFEGFDVATPSGHVTAASCLRPYCASESEDPPIRVNPR